MRHFFTCCALLLSALATHAATPPAALSLMPQKALSLRWQKLPTSAKSAVWLHIYCVPAGRDPQLKSMGVEKSGPITRADVSVGISITESPFWLDVFADSAGNKRLNSVKFEESQDVREIVLRWLEPAKRRGPVVLLNFGYTHWWEWKTLTFARGWNDSVHQQTFSYGGEGDVYNFLRFDQTDAQGRLVFVEKEGRENDVERTNIYRWNGREWDDVKLKYFVIGASVKTKSAADALAKKRGYGEVLRSDDFPKLRAGYWMWVAGRFRTSDEAQEIAREIVKNGDTATVRLAR